MKIQYAADLHLELSGHFNDEHDKCLAFIKKSVAESNAKHIVVVTHHLPTMAVVAPHHKKSPLNTAFAVDLHDYIADSRIYHARCKRGKGKIRSHREQP